MIEEIYDGEPSASVRAKLNQLIRSVNALESGDRTTTGEIWGMTEELKVFRFDGHEGFNATQFGLRAEENYELVSVQAGTYETNGSLDVKLNSIRVGVSPQSSYADNYPNNQKC